MKTSQANGLRIGLLAALALSLVACSSPPLSSSDNGYVIQVKVVSNDNQTEIASQYNGDILSWHPESGFALLKLSSAARQALMDKGVVLQATSNTTLGSPEVGSAGWNAWAGGWNAWAGGWNAWAGGWNAWAGGTSLPSSPAENNTTFMQIRLPQAHAISRNFGAGVKVAVIDTGIDLNHPAFSGRLAPSSQWKDFVDGDATPQEVSGGNGYGHGTAAAGIILQVAPKATILPIRVLDSTGKGDLSTVISAIDWAVNNGAQIINMSLGSVDTYDPLFTELSYARSKGVYVVASAGNNGAKDSITFPAKMWSWYDATRDIRGSLVGAGSVDNNDKLSSFTSYGSDLYGMAPGEKIYTAYPGSQVSYATGTSFASPLMAGALALAYGEVGSSYRTNLLTYLQNSFESQLVWWRQYSNGNSWCSVPNSGGNWCHGLGRLDIERLIRKLPGWTEPTRNTVMDYVGNGAFESGSMSKWSWATNASILSDSATGGLYQGSYSVQAAPTGGLGQTITGLKPNTTYTYTAWIRAPWSGESAYIGVRYYGGSEKTASTSSSNWERKSINFTTGSTNTSAEIYVWKSSGSGPVYADMFSVTPGTTVY